MKHITLSIILAIYSSTSFAGDLQNRLQLKQQVNDLFTQGHYAELEQIYRHLRDDDVRTEGGTNALDDELYAGILMNLKKNSSIISPNDQIWAQDEKSLKRWMKQFPLSPAPRIKYASLLLMHGWSYRGESTADKVTKNNRKYFHQYVYRTHKYLDSIKTSSASDPHWYALSLDIANYEGQDDATYQALLDEATTKHPRNYTIYDTAVEHYLPKWGGSTEALENLANYAVAKTNGEDMYARVYWTVESTPEFQGRDLFKETLVNWDRMKKGLNLIVTEYPSDWNITHYAYLACEAEDRPKSAEMFKQINGYVKENWMVHDHYSYCKAFAENKMEEYQRELAENGSATDPIAQLKFHEYQAAYKAYLSKANASDYKYNPHDIDETNKKKNEYDEALIKSQQQ